jgi:hypothetical protein
MEFRKEAGAFTCPVCHCRFRHNWIAWLIGIPLAVVVALAVFRAAHINGILAAFAGAIVSIGVVSSLGLYRLVSKGRGDVLPAEVVAHVPERKESVWVIVFLALLLLAIFLFAVFLWP